MATMREIVFDCEHPAVLARFWAAAIDGYAVRPYDEAEIRRLASLGRSPETDPTVMVDGPGASLCFQEVSEAKLGKNRVHLDLGCADHHAEAERLVRLGASVQAVHERHTVMIDPEGNEFCVTERR
jgi:hypothetical protein